VEPSDKPDAGDNRRLALPEWTARQALPALTRAALLFIASVALVATACMAGRADSEAETLLAQARIALETVESFRMDTEFDTPLPPPGHVTSLTVVWVAPQTIMTLAQGEGDPPFQQVYQEGGVCLARYAENGDWEWLDGGCADPGQLRPTFRAWLEIEEPEVVSEGDGVTLVRGKAVDGDGDDRDEPPVVSFWQLEIDKETHLIRRASGYAENSATALIDTALTGYNESFDAVLSGLNLPEGV
jgi:hypothetical protein